MGRISPSGAHQMFNGKVQSLDLKRSLLTVNTMQGGNIEIFPLNKGVHVMTLDGERIKLSELNLGANVLVSYEQKGDRRTVKQITVLKAGTKEEEEKKPAPPS